MADDLTVDTADGVRTLTLNRPGRRNALSGALVESLIQQIRRIDPEDGVRVAVLTAAGNKAFCAGGDLMDQQSGGQSFLEQHEGRRGYGELLIEMQKADVPLIAKVQGDALGGGLGLVMNCDLAVGSLDASFGTPEIKVGIFPMMVTAVMQRNISRKKAMELMLTGRKVSAEEAEKTGIINEAVSHDDLDERLEQWTDRLTGLSPDILRLGRRAFYETQDMDFEEAIHRLHSELTVNVMTEAAAEGVTAFIEGREPDWD